MKFSFYLEAWLYTKQHGITDYKIRKTGFKEYTLDFVQPKKKAAEVMHVGGAKS